MKAARAAWLVAGILVAGIALRIALQYPLHRYGNEADSLVTGFGAWEILAGDLRVFVSTGYRHGALASYLAAAASVFVGPGRAALALEVLATGILQMLVWWLALLELTGWRPREAGSARLLTFIALPSPAVVYWGIYFPTGYPEQILAATLVIWTGARFWRRGGWRALFAFAFASGFAFWMSILTFTVTMPLLVWLLWRRRVELLQWRSLAILTSGAVLGALPWLLFNLRYGWVSLKANWAVRSASGWEALAANAERLCVEVLPGLFAAAGQASPMPPPTRLESLMSWVALVLAMLVIALIGGAVFLRRRGATSQLAGPAEVSSLAALAAGIAGTTALLFIFSAAATVPGNIVRYLMPAFLVWPLVVALAWEIAAPLARRALELLALILLAGYAAAIPWPWTAERLALREALAVEHQMIERLAANGIDTVFGSFWEVYPLIFESGGKLAGSTLEPENDFHRFEERLPGGGCRWALVARGRLAARVREATGLRGPLERFSDGRWLFLPHSPGSSSAPEPTCPEVLGNLRAGFRSQLDGATATGVAPGRLRDGRPALASPRVGP